MLLILLALALVAAFALGFALGQARARRDADARARTAALPAPETPGPPAAPRAPPAADKPPAVPAAIATAPAPAHPAPDNAVAERARILRALESETTALRGEIATRDAALVHLRELAHERERLFAALGEARAETARYRQYVIDLEDNAPPPLLGGPGTPDDLKLIVGVGPILERMLFQLGITTYRQIARWTERDIDEIDARLPEFPGRIRRDGWVTQARALHQSKYGEPVPGRERT